MIRLDFVFRLQAPLPPGPYVNPVTRVTATVDGLTLRTPLPRPYFFALELAEHFHMPPDFIPAWIAACQSATAAEASGDGGSAREPRPLLARPQAAEWWRYMWEKPALRLAWPVPDIVLVDLALWQDRRTHAVQRVLVWPEGASTLVIPAAADWLVVRQQHRPGRTAPAPAWLRARSEVIRELDSYLRWHEQPVPHWVYRGGEAHSFLIRSLCGQQSGEAPAHFRPVEPDQCREASPSGPVHESSK